MPRETSISRVEVLTCPSCGHPLEGSPSKCDYCGSGFYYETLDKKTGLERDRFFEEWLVKFVARVAQVVEVEFSWGVVSAENFTFGLVVGDDDYVELSFEKDGRGRGVYVLDFRPDEGHGEGADVHWSAWLEVVPVHGKDGATVYRVRGGGFLRFAIGSFSGEDVKSFNLDSLLGQTLRRLIGQNVGF